MKEEIIKAIKGKLQIEIKYLDLNYYVLVNPYIYGDDLFQESFVWGWIELNGTCYKFFLDKIKDLKVLKKTFEIEKGVEYYYSTEEDHFAAIEEITHYITFKSKR